MRTHVVLVPGFGGFDALGELHYYDGVTKLVSGEISLHYFENLPTAAVTTRAKRLRRFLRKLVDRNMVQRGEPIVLGGHSTGGLDIRQLLRDLSAEGDREMLDRIRKVAFLSVPQRGTNIADWVKRHGRARELMVEAFRLTVRTEMDLPSRLMRLWGTAEPHLPQMPQFVEKITQWLVPGTSQLIAALEDVRCDFVPAHPDDGLEQADARLARSEVSLWVDDVDHDFFAIDDLASLASDPRRLVESLDDDVELWEACGITPRSYATMGNRTLPLADLDGDRDPRSLKAVARALHDDSEAPGTDGVYRVAYAACAGGPFVAGPQPAVRWLGGAAFEDPPIEDWQNDGIVNTASMLLPVGDNILVRGDHADIIGHFEQVPNIGLPEARRIPGARKWSAYDLLGSRTDISLDNFSPDAFKLVWLDLFGFAAE